ncbi:hypothetical protein HYU23_02935 [Candidatus Woesearchaeota archaeon]|nr:hypothetical protein [Candidatus Woesearchaeota archaeon]
MKIKELYNKKIIFILILIIFALITLLTRYYGAADIGDYADTAKFFAGDYNGKIRSSNSHILGFIHYPLVKLTESYIGFKITSIVLLIFIMFSVYKISNYNKKALWLLLISPVVWYMGPWINPIQIGSLILLWSYYFANKYDKEGKIKYLTYFGLLIGLGWSVWDGIFFFGGFLAIIYMYNKKSYELLYFAILILVGLIPRLALDFYLFNFPFFGMIKNMTGIILSTWGGIHNRGWAHAYPSITTFISILIAIPIGYWTLYKKERIAKYKKEIVFLSLCLLIVLMNQQIRYIMAFAPIVILLLTKELNKKEIKIHFIISIIVILLFITPYIIQTKYSIKNKLHGADFTDVLENPFELKLSKTFVQDLIVQDIKEIAKEYPNEVFVVGNAEDDYQALARLYWGKDVNEFVSIQDYNLFMENKNTIFEIKFMPTPNINYRRQIWIAGGMNKNENDNTDYKNIKLGIGLENPVNIEGFKFVKKYNILYFSKKLETNSL